jgi:GTP cyclohydrolase I
VTIVREEDDVLILRPDDRRWVDVDTKAIAEACRTILIAVGEDPDREGLRDTPDRYARWWAEFMEHDAGSWDTAFEQVASGQLVVVGGITTWTLCEHHLLPFRCELAVGYLTAGMVLGLSKFARIVQHHAHRLQLQERLTDDVARTVQLVTGSPDVAVLARGVHLCMGMRGVRTPAVMTTSTMLGEFDSNVSTRSEFLDLARATEHPK